MTWNHRLIRHTEPNGEIWLGIHEVYYLDDGTPDMVTENAIGASGETVEEIIETLERMRRCVEKPILEMEYFVERAKNSSGEPNAFN